MKITNKHGLPGAFVRAAENDPYDRGESDFTANSLAQPARAAALIEKHFDTIEVDVSTKVAAIIGQGAHVIATRAARPDIDICEKRFFAKFEVDGHEYTVSAQVDLFEPDSGTLYDWKTTKSYAFSRKAGNGQKPEWQSQLNVGCEILRRNGLDPRRLQIIAMLKDWSRREAGQSGCPETEVVAVDIDMWPRQKTTAWIEERIRAHVAAKTELPQCTSEETWNGRRCPDWCDAKSVCNQWKKISQTGIITPAKSGWKMMLEAQDEQHRAAVLVGKGKG